MPSRPKKVLLIHHGGGIGGAPISMLQLAEALGRDRFEPQVVFTEQGPVLQFAAAMGLNPRVVPMPSAFFYGMHVPVRLRNMMSFALHYRRTVATARELVREIRPDLVHLNTSVLVPVAVGVKQTSTPLVWHVRESAGPNLAVRSWHVGRIKSLSDFIVTNSCYVARDYVDSKPLAVIHNALDQKRFTPTGSETRARIRAELGIPEEAAVIGIIGTVQEPKGHYVLVEAAASVVRDVPNVRFLVVGGGVGEEYANTVKDGIKRLLGLPLDNLERMQTLTRRLGLEKYFVFTGHRADIPEVLSAIDVLVFPSLRPEGFGRPLIEAMAMGRPVVATDVGPTREIVGDDGAVLVMPADARALSLGLVRVLKDRELVERLADAGRRRFLEHFTIEDMVAKVRDVYEQVLQGTTPSTATRKVRRNGP